MKKFLTADVVANNIRMRRSVDDRIVVVAEGGTDATLFEYLCDRESCVIQIARDRDTAVDAVRILNAVAFKHCIAIVDADYARLLGNLEDESNVFHTDSHDVETMLLCSPSLDRVVSELGSREKIEAFTSARSPMLVSEIFELVAPIGAMRLLSQRQNLALRFKGLRFLNFIDRNTATLDVRELVREVFRRTNLAEQDENSVVDAVNAILREGFELRDLCQGHDCIEALLILLTKLLGNRKKTELSTELLERELRLAYSDLFFSETKLFAVLVEHESEVAPRRIVRRP